MTILWVMSLFFKLINDNFYRISFLFNVLFFVIFCYQKQASTVGFKLSMFVPYINKIFFLIKDKIKMKFSLV